MFDPRKIEELVDEAFAAGMQAGISRGLVNAAQIVMEMGELEVAQRLLDRAAEMNEMPR